jgi:hypothetical protein
MNLFNERALSRRFRNADNGRPITLLSPPLKATLALGVAISVAGGLWATLARIPLTVTGTGVLLPVDTLSTTASQIDGVVQWMFTQPAEEWHQLAWQFQQKSEDFNDQAMVSLAKRIITESEVARTPSPGQRDTAYVRFRGKYFERGRLLLWVQSEIQKSSLASSLDQLNRTMRANDEKRKNITAQQNGLRNELETRSSFLENMKGLEAKGFVTRASILQEQATLDGIKSQILNNDNQLISLDRDRDQAYQNVRSQLVNLLQQQFVFAPRNAYLDQLNAQAGEAVSRGKQLLSLSDQPLNGATLVPVFFGSNESAQVRPGMSALATPAGYKRAEVGGIRGRVVFRALLPGNLDLVTGTPAVAQQIASREPSPTLAVLALERTTSEVGTNSGGYRWSSRSDLPFPPIPGERLDVEVTTRTVRPIELVFPALKQALGITPPVIPSAVQSGTSK